MIYILQVFLRTEWTDNLMMHLTVMRRMLPILAASGHNHYTKYLHLYLHLEEKHPEVYQHLFCKDSMWSGDQRGSGQDCLLSLSLSRCWCVASKQLVIWLEEPVWVRPNVWYQYGYYQTVRQQRWTWQCNNFLLSATKLASNTKTHLLIKWQRMCPTPIKWFITCPQ